MKTILSFIDWYLPGYRAGGTLKAFANQVAHFEGIYNFKIITRDTDYCETTPYNNIKSDQWNRLSANSEVYYVSAKNSSYSLFKNLVKSTDFDAVYIHGVYSFWYSILPVILAKQKKTPRIVVVAHGMLGKHSLSVKSGKKDIFLKAGKLLGLYKGVVFHAANQSEADDVRKAVGPKATVIVAEELPMKVILPEWVQREKKPGELSLLSVARISPEKNTLYALEVLADCKHGNISYDIYGPVYNEGYWNECKTVISRMPANVKVTYKGSLQGDQVLQTIRNYHCMFMPTTGENFGHTILESFMAASPVLISSNTPWRNLTAKKAGWDIDLSDKKEFIKAIETLTDLHQTDYDVISQSAQKFAQAFMNDKSILEQNKRLFDHE